MEIPEPGSAIPALGFGAVTRTDFVRYAGASNDFNPMHHDDSVARIRGEPSVFGHGMLSMGLVASFVASWAPDALFESIGVRFRDRLWPGDEPVASGTVRSVERYGDAVRVVVELRLTAGERVLLTGAATLALR